MEWHPNRQTPREVVFHKAEWWHVSGMIGASRMDDGCHQLSLKIKWKQGLPRLAKSSRFYWRAMSAGRLELGSGDIVS